ncbi:sigma 54-interacting transcriptional regulator [Rhodoplanes sp. TEM]|uniref:Sigma 54-interacting transcriptional regulator n=1 Tax=Rhodoplanes tepidamans TaxID=200616 RepID=A0ABT5JDH5_RHOTP|nr:MULTISPECIES: sigma 54-interacting transcriptional regulator [Rhodoplanes]MDC7787682.1 sigma 54-interacting transcriptional regulator [Rhodoplanes tepidamans]MDC7983056.1 sigma 54-interacting transcriptional regulator [Rhodoplanes sp. TEM]MDQ0356438.1 DNA-binding NtrC family response regulator [Rhodoplanes tepidamans]
MPSVVPPGLVELASFLEGLPEPHILCDRDYRVVAANSAYRRACAGGAEVVGARCYEISHRYARPCDQVGETCPLSACRQTGRRERVVHLHHSATGEIYESIDVTPIRDATGEIVYFVERLEELPVGRGVAHAQGLLGHSPAFRRMLDLISRVAPSDATVLLQGESGTGKELVAKAIHDASRRAEGPFVVLDCTGLPETLFESELFGHEKGAFTGAATRKTGLVEAAAGGTLFLDEVGDSPPSTQVKLLRLLETGTFRRVGSTELRRADFRLVSATHRPLRQMSAAGEFRQDLFFRLNTFPICLPALRERRQDIPLLAQALLMRVAPGRHLRLSPAAVDVLVAYDYPGNVRELRNLVERASLLCDGGEIRPEHLAEEVRRGSADAAPALDMALDMAGASAAAGPMRWDALQAQLLRDTVAAHRGTRGELAAKLGISVRTLYRRLAEAKIDLDGEPKPGPAEHPRTAAPRRRSVTPP